MIKDTGILSEHCLIQSYIPGPMVNLNLFLLHIPVPQNTLLWQAAEGILYWNWVVQQTFLVRPGSKVPGHSENTVVIFL